MNWFQVLLSFFNLRRYTTALMVATALVANLVSNLATLLAYACGSAAAAEQFVLNAIAKYIVRVSVTRHRRRRLLASTLSAGRAWEMLIATS